MHTRYIDMHTYSNGMGTVDFLDVGRGALVRRGEGLLTLNLVI